MFQQLLSFLPHKLGMIALIVSAIGSLAGVVLWLAGVRFSRRILTLAAVGLGTGVGMKLPLWCNWSVDPMGPAVGGAFVLGISAFVLHRVWVGAWLGVLLSAWTGLGVWAVKARGIEWNWPDYTGRTLPQYLVDLWQSLPEPMQKYLPACAAASMAAAIIWALLWPRAGTMLLWSFAGVSMLLTLGSALLAQARPSALRHFPRQLSAQCAVLAGLVALGAILQWRLTPAAKPAGPEKSEKKKDRRKD